VIPRNVLLAYAAGLFDGEGCCGVYANGAKHCAVRVQLVLTTPHGPALFADLFGGNVKLSGYRRPKALPVYVWAVTADRAANALQAMLPWLREKRGQADLCIEARTIQRGRRRGKGAAYKEHEMARITEIRSQVGALKRAATP